MNRRDANTVGDFRYETTAARVGWPAVGEPMRVVDILRTIEFLVPPTAGDKAAYRQQLTRVRQAVAGLCRVGGTATKLTLGDQVQHAEEMAQRYLGVKHAP